MEESTLGNGAVDGSVLLRTHTSPVQIRSMQRLGKPAGADHLPRPRLPPRLRPDPLADVPPGGGPVRGRGRSPFADLKGTLAAFARAYFGEGTKTRFRPELLPVHRAEARRWTSPARSAAARGGRRKRDGGARDLQGDGLARGARRRHGPPEGARERRHDPEGTAASRSAWASSGWRCSATASTTCACTSRTTCASWSSSDAPAMRISLNWLSEYVALPEAVEGSRERLTAVGPRDRGDRADRARGSRASSPRGSSPRRSTRTRRSSPSPASTRGGAEPLQIVCGAKNYQVGDMVPLATVGATLPGGTKIEKASCAASSRSGCSAPRGSSGSPRRRAGCSSSTAASRRVPPSARRSGSRTCSSR